MYIKYMIRKHNEMIKQIYLACHLFLQFKYQAVLFDS